MYRQIELDYLYDPLPMIYSHFGIDPSKFPKESYIVGTSLLMLINQCSKFSRLKILICCPNKDEIKLISDIYVNSEFSFKSKNLDITVTNKPIEMQRLGLAKCYMNIHSKVIMYSDKFFKLDVIDSLDSIADFYYQIKTHKEITVGDNVINYEIVKIWFSKCCKNIQGDLIVENDTAYNLNNLSNKLIGNLLQKYAEDIKEIVFLEL
jgi:hypothetical protein